MEEWFNLYQDTSLLYLMNTNFYNYTETITIDNSTLVLFDAIYDSSNYLLNHKNIWNFNYTNKDKKLLTVYNKQVPYIFNDKGLIDINVQSYDSYGNLIEENEEGFINLI